MEQEISALRQEMLWRPRLEQKWANILDRISTIVYTRDNLDEAKKELAELRREFREIDSERKKLKKSILVPYTTFEKIYKNSVSNYYYKAESVLLGAIELAETEILSEYDAELQAYFSELCVAHGLDWLTFQETGVKATVTEAKKKSHKKDKEQLRSYVERIKGEVSTILTMGDSSAEIMAYYKLQKGPRSLEAAIRDANEFCAAAEKEREALNCQKQTDAEQEIAFRVQQIIPEQTASDQAEEIVECVFTVKAPIVKLKKLKEFMTSEGIVYE